MAHFQVAFSTAIVLSCSYWLSQLWLFISTGLYKKEKKVFSLFCLLGVLLFLLGVLFAYFIVFPLVFSVLMNFGSGVDKPFITIKSYLSFVMQFILVFGFVFEMPLCLLLLCRTGILSPATLKKMRKSAVVVLSLVAAFITPPDVLSMFLLLVPLLVLYEFSILLASIFYF